MSVRYFIENGQAISPPMGLEWDGCLVSFLFFNGAGQPVNVVGLPAVSQSLYDTGDIWKTVYPFANGEWRFNGPASRVKIDLTGVTGYSTYRVVIWRTDDPMPMIPGGAFVGLRGLITQPYTEANVKSGLQFYLRASWPSTDVIVQATTRKLSFVTGAKPVIIKLRDFQYVSEEISISLYANPVGVGASGTVVPIRNYNRVNPVASTVTARTNVTTTSDGTLFDGPEYFFGSANAAQRNQNSIPLGRERVLPANSSFLVAITAAAGVGNSRAQYFLDWYEGGTDIPIQPQ